MKKQIIESPEGVSQLMKELWLKHISKASMPSNNVFEVQLPPPTAADYARNNEDKRPDDDQEDLYGGWC